MNKNRMILAVSGGVIGLAVLVLAYFTWNAYSAKVAALEGDMDEGTDGLEAVQSKAQSLSRKDIYPCAESVKAIGANAERLAEWQAEARRLAARGDRPVRTMTPAQFKTDLIADAKRLSSLPGLVNGALVKPEFAYGPFRPYIAEGKMPTDAELPELLRRWDDVQLIVETLASCGIAELVNVEFKVEKKAEADDAAAVKKKKAKRPAAKKRANAADAAAALEPSACSYVITFAAKAPAFVKAVNALGTNERFIVVDGFTVTRTSDPIADALGAGKKEAAAATGRAGRRGRRGAAVVEEKKAETDDAKHEGIVTDPVLDAPFTVALALTVYDFRTLSEDAAKAGAEDKKEEAGK